MAIGNKDFVHLHIHSDRSNLDGVPNPENYLEAALKRGFKSIALTDHGNMAGVMDMYLASLDPKYADVKPIFGIEAYYDVDMSIKDKEKSNSYHLILLAKNYTGLKNLFKVSSLAFIDGFYYKPRIDAKILKKYCSDGNVIATSACVAGRIPSLLFENTSEAREEARKEALLMKKIFGEDFYLEIQFMEPFQEREKDGTIKTIHKQAICNKRMIALAKELNIKIVLTNDVHFINKSDLEVQETMIKIETPKFEYPVCNAWLKTVVELEEARSKWHDYITKQEFIRYIRNTKEAADKCSRVDIPLGQYHLPKFDIQSHKYYEVGFDRNKLVTKIIAVGWKNFKENFKKINNRELSEEEYATYLKRIKYEKSVIDKADFWDYFLIIQDIICYANDQNIAVGDARGSVAGCLCAMLMGITKTDPIRYNLLFERFLNPSRISAVRKYGEFLCNFKEYPNNRYFHLDMAEEEYQNCSSKFDFGENIEH